MGSKSSKQEQQNRKKNIADYLLAESKIAPWVWDAANEICEQTGASIVDALIAQEAIKTNELFLFICQKCKIPHLSLLDYEISREVLNILPQELCEKYFILPIDKLGRILTIAMVDPMDEEAIEAIRRAVPDLRIKPILCNSPHLKTVFSKLGFHYTELHEIRPDKPESIQDSLLRQTAEGLRKNPSVFVPLSGDNPVDEPSQPSRQGFADPLTNHLFEASIYRDKDPAVMSALSVKLFSFLSRLDHIKENIDWLEKDEFHLHLLDADMELLDTLEKLGRGPAIETAKLKHQKIDEEFKDWVLSLQGADKDMNFVVSLMFMIGRLGHSKYLVEGFIRTFLSDKIKIDPTLGD